MFDLLEKRWFKWSVIGGSLGILFLILGGMALSHYLEIRKIEQARIHKREAQLAYEEKFRIGMMRIRQNLKLDHFLAAYKNYQLTPAPPANDPMALQDYLEVLYRIGNGLLQSQLLKESEEVFTTVREYEGQVSQTDEALSRIESRRRLDSARLFLNQGIQMHEQKRYREALAEYKKTDQELRFVDRLHFDDVKTEWEKLGSLLGEAKFYVYCDDVQNFVDEAYRKLKLQDFKDAYKQLSNASNALSRAAFLRPDSPEVKKLRQKLADGDGELAYLQPNSLPIWNAYKKDDLGKEPYYFFMDAYTFDTQVDPKTHVFKISFKYYLESREARAFIVRYRITFSNNQDVFNGHFIDPGMVQEGKDPEALTLIYKQEIPEIYRGLSIQRIELKIFNDKDEIVSQITRAYRKQS